MNPGTAPLPAGRRTARPAREAVRDTSAPAPYRTGHQPPAHDAESRPARPARPAPDVPGAPAPAGRPYGTPSHRYRDTHPQEIRI